MKTNTVKGKKVLIRSVSTYVPLEPVAQATFDDLTQRLGADRGHAEFLKLNQLSKDREFMRCSHRKKFRNVCHFSMKAHGDAYLVNGSHNHPSEKEQYKNGLPQALADVVVEIVRNPAISP